MNSDFQARSASYRATVERCLAELRRGGAIGLTGRGFAAIALAAEMVEEASFANLQSASRRGRRSGPRLILTASRAADLGLMPPGGAGRALAICQLPAAIGAEAVRQLADPTVETRDTPALGVTLTDDLPLKLAEAAIDLAKAARLLPAAIMIALPPDALGNWVDETFVLRLHRPRRASARARRFLEARRLRRACRCMARRTPRSSPSAPPTAARSTWRS